MNSYSLLVQDEAVRTMFLTNFLYIQAKAAQRYPCPYSFTALLNVMAAVQCFVVAVVVERDWKEWKLGWNVRLLASAYTVCSN